MKPNGRPISGNTRSISRSLFAIAERFDWETAVVWEDIRFDYGETRLAAAGFIQNRLHILIFTERGETVRVISLRKANDKEVRFYETAKREAE